MEDLRLMLETIGFKMIEIMPLSESAGIISQWVPGTNAQNYVVSASIKAVKPGPHSEP